MTEEGCFKLLKIFENNDFSIFVHKQSIVIQRQSVASKKHLLLFDIQSVVV